MASVDEITKAYNAQQNKAGTTAPRLCVSDKCYDRHCSGSRVSGNCADYAHDSRTPGC